MKALSPLNKNKSALSNVVGYVLLISITISLSVLVYGWLRFYVDVQDIKTCPDGVNIIIESYQCSPSITRGPAGSLNVTLKNKGLFTVDGYELRVHDREDADFGLYSFGFVEEIIHPGEEFTKIYNFGEVEEVVLTTVTLIEVQPFIKEGATKLRCKSHVSQKVECS